MRPLLLALCCLALPAAAQTPLTATEFEAHVTGKTLTYQQYDFIFGVEEYLPDRKVRWSVAPNECQYGTWYQEGENICFLYEYSPVPACWTFWLQGGVLHALSVHEAPGAELHVVDTSTQPLPCPGPDVGV